MKHAKPILLIVVILSLQAYAQNLEPLSPEIEDFVLTSVNIDSLLLTVRHLTGAEPFEIDGVMDSIYTRYSYAPGIFIAQQYLRRRLEKYGYLVELDPFTLGKTSTLVNLNNVVATKEGTLYPNEYMIICAHYDATSSSTPWSWAPGADDNGSGTAAVIEAARVMKNVDTNYSIRFILFAAEEQGLIGSKAFADEAADAGENIVGVINMDMIGYDANDDGAFDIHSGYQVIASNNMGNEISANVIDWNLDLFPTHKTTNASSRSDHDSFWTHGYPAVMLIEDMSSDFNEYYHSGLDILDNMNSDYYHEMAKLAIGSLAKFAGVTSISTPVEEDLTVRSFALFDPYPNPFNPSVTIEYELPSSSEVTIGVYNLLGNKITTLLDRQQSAGHYGFSWTAVDDRGNQLSSGTYFIRMVAGGQVNTKKVMLVR